MRRRLVIERLGHRGEGIARDHGGLVFVPFALPGETVIAEVEGERARLLDIVEAAPERVEPLCRHFGRCGGCVAQSLAPDAYARWKRGLVETALRNAGLDFDVGPLVDAHGDGRRRVAFHARCDGGAVRLGFMQARSHEIVEIDACPLLELGLSHAPKVARVLAQALAARKKPLDVAITLTSGGLDVDLRGAGALEESETRALLGFAESLDLARLANHGRLIALRRPPAVAAGETWVVPPPGAFLQATARGEAEIAARVEAAIGASAGRVADLFCGVGAFALRLSARAQVTAVDSDAPAVEALDKAARAAMRPVEARARDLFRSPLTADELARFDAVVFDPPRAGASAQAREIARSGVRHVVAVSCDPQSFARDAAILKEGGYAAGVVTPIDQFRHSPHVEIVAGFERRSKPPRRRLLSR
ncbi:class I SAM-dependent RNA methyltransferase [Methylosinus sp. Sm6]|uniref:class I SAM-dependent RNA methyltransferase n=1 Tax=Methylosinus sp. Sm6 TaxID=2866948 RepID=UPI001C99A78F|nr:methyltransferase [Methylosinus sp. Sm6]MBY6242052.1 methyltransferase [Methylosinus sp. Sm6]